MTDSADLDAMMPRGGDTTGYTDLRPDETRMVHVFAHGEWHVGEPGPTDAAGTPGRATWCGLKA